MVRKLAALAWLLALSSASGCSWMSPPRKADPMAALFVDPVYRGQMERGTRDEPYKTIDAAWKKIAGSSQLILAPGTYRTNLAVVQNLQITGQDDARPAVLLAANPRLPVISLAENVSVGLVNLEIGEGSVGVQGARGAQVSIMNSRIRDNRGPGLALVASRSLRRRPPLSLARGTTFSGNAVGVAMLDNALSLVDCTLTQNRGAGLVCEGDSSLNLVAGRVTANAREGVAIDMGNRARLSISQCDIQGNGGDGVRVTPAEHSWFDTSQILVEKNSIKSNKGWGLSILDRESGAPQTVETGFARLKLDENAFADNTRGMAAGVEAQ